MRRWMPLALTLMFASPAAGQSADPAPEIITSGSGIVTFTPDLAVLQVAVETLDEKVSEASKENARKVTSVMRALEDLGLPERDRATVTFDVIPEYAHERDGRRVLAGYRVRNVLRVVIDEPANVGSVVDAVIEAGANAITRVSFTSSDIERLRGEAIAAAVADARSTAELISEAAGGSLGDLIEIRFQRVDPPSTYDLAVEELRAEVETPIVAGEHVVRAVVQTRWRFNKSG